MLRIVVARRMSLDGQQTRSDGQRIVSLLALLAPSAPNPKSPATHQDDYCKHDPEQAAVVGRRGYKIVHPLRPLALASLGLAGDSLVHLNGDKCHLFAPRVTLSLFRRIPG